MESSLKNKHSHKQSAAFPTQEKYILEETDTREAYVDNAKSQMDQSNIGGEYQLRSPMKQVIDDFSNNTLTIM